MEITIREAVPDDGAAFRDHMLKIYNEPEVYSPFTPEEYTNTAQQESRRIELFHEMDNSLFLVAATEDNTVVGSLRLEGNTVKSVRHSAMLAIYVDSDYRGQGIGKRLLENALGWARNSDVLTRVELEVYTRNVPAIRLYEKFGFTIEGTRHRMFFQNGEYLDEHIMALWW